MAKFRVQTELTADKAGTAAVQSEFKKVSAGAKQASIDVKDLTKSIGAGISILAVARANLQAMAPVMERNGQLFKEWAVSLGMNAGAVKGLTLAMDSLIHPSHIIQNAIEATAEGSRRLAKEIVGETNVVLNLSKAQLKAVDSYLAMGGAAGLAARRAAESAKEQQAMLDEMERLREEYQRNQERAAEERQRANEEYRRQLQAVLDRLNPVAAAERDLQEQIDLVTRALAAGGTNANLYERALASLRAELADLTRVAELVPESIPLLETSPRDLPQTHSNPTGGHMTVEGIDTAASRYNDAFKEANAQLAANFEGAMKGAIGAAWAEFRATGEVNIQALGQTLMNTLLDAALEYFITMAANQAKLKMEGASTAGTTTGGMGGMGWFAVAAVAIEAYAAHVAKQKSKDYDRNIMYTGGISGGNVNANWNFTNPDFEAGKEANFERPLRDAIEAWLEAFRSATGDAITGLGEITITARNDGSEFEAIFAGVVVGRFASMEEAMLEGVRAAFKAEDFAGTLDPILRQVVDNYKGDAKEFLAALDRVGGILDEISGLSEIEIALRDLPKQSAALANELQGLGVSMADATVISSQWQAQQMQNLRDQITGHQQSEAEQLAQRQREAAMFNAQLALDEAKIRAEMANLQNQQIIEQAKVDVAQAGAQAQLEIINATLAAYGQVLAAIQSVAPIDIGEIRLPGGGGGRSRGGGRVSAGPSEAEQRATAFLAFLEQLRLDGLTGYERALADLAAAFAEHAQAAAEMENGEALLAAARRQALADLREDVIDAFGSPMETLRDRLAEVRQRVEDWYAANDALGDQFLAGEISLQQLMAALAESNQLWAEFGDMARGELLSLALYFTEALGDTEESARIRAELAQLEWDFKKLEMRMLLETYAEIGWINQQTVDYWTNFLDNLPTDLPAAMLPGAGGSAGDGGLQAAINRLRSAIENLRKSNEAMLLGDNSPLSTADQFAEAQRRYNETLAAAQGGDLQAIEDFAAVRDQYLALAAAMYGTAGGGYQSIFQQSLQAGQDLATAGQAILDAIPPQMQGVEDRLDTIAEILAAIAASQLPVVNPPGGAGGPPGPPGHHPPPGGHPRPGEDDYYPPGRPPGGPPRPGDSQGFAGGETVSELRAMNEQLRMLLAATEEQTRSANSNSLRRVATVGGGRGISVRRGN